MSDQPRTAIIEPGDVWVDNDPREKGERTIMVVRVCSDADCLRGKSRRDLLEHAHVVSNRGTKSIIRADRFKPTRRDGYTLRHRLGSPSENGSNPAGEQ